MDKLRAKIEGIATAGLSDNLKGKVGSLLEKDKAMREAILAKKIEIFKIIASVGTLVAPGENIGYYKEVSHNVYFSENECDIRVKPYLINHPVDGKIEDVVRKFESVFYLMCDDAIERIENSIAAMKKIGEDEFSKLVEVRKKLAKLKT